MFYFKDCKILIVIHHLSCHVMQSSPGAVNISRPHLLLGCPVEGDLLPAGGGEPHLGVPHLGVGAGPVGGARGGVGGPGG